MTNDEILSEAHRTCTTYCFLGDEKYSFTDDHILTFAHSLLNSLSLSNAALVQELHELKLKGHTK